MFDPSIDLDTYFITDHLSPSQEWLPSEYEIRLVVTDGYTDESVTETYRFTVVE
ncbi:hypothetical protein [Halodesulfurarchaeum sp.]|uniref:hypothetical protein n=1 Tax=Halodesulfurarchaeum sp. TaxID=1980530 RepID=UPI002FC359E0